MIKIFFRCQLTINKILFLFLLILLNYFLQEKWDSMTRRWRESTSFVQSVALFLIDEVHLLNDDTRGPTMEVKSNINV